MTDLDRDPSELALGFLPALLRSMESHHLLEIEKRLASSGAETFRRRPARRRTRECLPARRPPSRHRRH